ncbi:MAG: ECF transporter S component [Asgard group archaeon]|nr:ECF transporter S component [Asgard group archaeon]
MIWVTFVDSMSKKQSKSNLVHEEESLVIDKEKTKESENTEHFAVEKLPEMREYSGKTITIEIAAGAILGSLSIIIGFTWDAIVERIGGFGPQFAPGMTWLDFLAIPILVAFFVFGIVSGIIAAIIGCGAIAFYLSESFGWLAMWPKFFASASMFVIPWIILRIIRRREGKKQRPFFKSFSYSSETFKPLRNYSFMMACAILGRAFVMFLLNTLIVAPTFFWLYSGKGEFTSVFTDPILYLTLGGGYFAWNIVQGIIDAIISYSIVYPTNLYKRYATW